MVNNSVGKGKKKARNREESRWMGIKIEILTGLWNFILGVSKKNPKPFCFFLACITEMLYICIVNQPSINIKIPTHELERNEEEGGRKRI